MIKRCLILFLIIIFSLNVLGQTTQIGARICNIGKECGIADGVCPEDFFPDDVSCYIIDPDCCTINDAYWSSDVNGNIKVDSVTVGETTYMHVKTSDCIGKEARFILSSVSSGLFTGKDTNLVDCTEGNTDFPECPFAKRTVTTQDFSEPLVAVTAAGEDTSKLRFEVKINPSLVSPLLEVIGDENFGEGQEIILDACDNVWLDPSLCTGELATCAQCGSSFSASNCAGWKCDASECIDGFKTLTCPTLPQGCTIATPPLQIKCFTKTIPFPFFTEFNAAIVILLLASYYGYRLYRKKK